MVRFVEDLPPAKKALATMPSRTDQVLLVEYDRSPCGNDAATNAMEQQDCGAMLNPVLSENSIWPGFASRTIRQTRCSFAVMRLGVPCSPANFPCFGG
jgi:hypothetical protein